MVIVPLGALAQDVEHAGPDRDRQLHRSVVRQPPPVPLTIMSWNLSDAVAAGVIDRFEPAPAVWRHTFGAERRFVRSQNSFDPSQISVDIVLLQGVKTVREVSKLFPARRWKVMVSRQILSVSGRRGLSSYQVPAAFSTTAIAARYRRGMRVTGQDHLLDLANSEPELIEIETDESSSVKGDTNTGSKTILQNPQAGLAVRVLYEGQVMWVVSAAFPNRCADKGGECPERGVLSSWVDARRAEGFPVIAGGRISTVGRNVVESTADDGQKKRSGTVDGCGRQAIEGDVKLEGRGSVIEKAGCIAMLRLEPPARRTTVQLERERVPIDDFDSEDFENRVTNISDDDHD